jgi:hypothetical protein
LRELPDRLGLNPKKLSVYIGHSDIRTTYNRYGHLMPGGEAQDAAQLDAFLDEASGAGSFSDGFSDSTPGTAKAPSSSGLSEYRHGDSKTDEVRGLEPDLALWLALIAALSR